MQTENLMGTIIVFIAAGILALLSFRSFKEKGFLLNNAYIYASEEERKTMNKKPWYRQSAIAFSLLSVACILSGLDMILDNKACQILAILFLVGTVLYAIVSSAMILKGENR